MFWPPPVVMLITASQPALMRGRNSWNSAGDGDGRPSIGSRACRWTMAAPASAAPIASWAICAGVIGRYALIVGVWMAPVMAQVTITERLEGWVAATRISCARQSDTSRPAHPAVAHDATAAGWLDGQSTLR
jgi:hypothetical protein